MYNTIFVTCISPRIATVIQGKNYFHNTITVIMSRPQSNVTKTKHLDMHGLTLKTRV